jgi:hypothetical protein
MVHPMRPHSVIASSGIALLLGTGLARAQEAPPVPLAPPPPPAGPPGRPPPDARFITPSFSPLHLIIGPVFEAQVELRVLPHVGVAILGGGGKVTVDNGLEEVDVSVYEIGGQVNVYWRQFDGWHLGVEPMYAHASVDEPGLKVRGNGFALGGYAGYKHIFDMGLTLIVQLGVDVMVVEAEADTGETASEEDVFPLLNLNAGWSF